MPNGGAVSARPHVLFVDDEPRILGALRRMLRTHRDRWDMSFAESGEEALAVMLDTPCDVIVSDYRMPGMDGAQLLDRVCRDHPGTARVILSGQTNEDNLLGIMVRAHELLTKPSTPEQLVATVDRLLGARSSQAVLGFASLPSAPGTLAELMTALAGEASAESIGSIVSRDPAAAAKVLHLANSSAYSPGRPISDVEEAVQLLGPHTARGLIVTHDLVRVLDVTSVLTVDWIDRLTLHAVQTARLCRLLAAGTDWVSDAAAAGLLHEVGQLALASAQPAVFAEALTAWPDSGAALDVGHQRVGADLLNLWGLPPAVVGAVAGHGRTGEVSSGSDVSSAVSLAHLVVEADLGPVCGPIGRPPPDESRLDAAARDAVRQWRDERSDHR